jgi:metallo-beta-lactamase family protein
MINVTCLGGAGTVTGSCYLLEYGKDKVLIDCGLFQGGHKVEEHNWSPWDFDPASLPVLCLTHAHIDHSGRIPKLFKDGFRGQVITSGPTAELCEIMLLDSAHIQEMEAEWQTRKNRRTGDEDVQPLYTVPDAEQCLSLFHPVENGQIVDLLPGITARLTNAGHMLGASILELWVKDGLNETKIVFSGDLGRRHQVIIKDPATITDAHYLFIESTYGNRLHKNLEESTAELLEAIRYSTTRREKILIPAFAVGRTQEILYILSGMHRQGLLPAIPIYLDSPLAIRATEIFRKNKQYYDEEAQAIIEQGLDPLNLPTLQPTLTVEESMRINKEPQPAIVIAGNGMCTAGRIKHHLKHNLWRSGCSIIIVGYQPPGTTGRLLVEGAKSVRIFRENVAVRAKVFTIGGFSAHADRDELFEWVGHFRKSRPRVYVVHGEDVVRNQFASLIQEKLGLTAFVPSWEEKLGLKPFTAPPLRLEKKEQQAGVMELLKLANDEMATLRAAAAHNRLPLESASIRSDLSKVIKTLRSINIVARNA